MIRSIYVDGLRSLKEFNLALKPGLNVLVGPNGSGKSNILAALELVSILNKHGVRDINSKIHSMDLEDLFDIRKKDRTIHIRVTGERTPTEQDIEKIEFSYEFELGYKPDEMEKVSYSMQSLEMEALPSTANLPAQKLSIVYNEGKTRVNQVDDKFSMKDYPPKFIENHFNNFQNKNNESFKFNSLIGAVASMTGLSNIVKHEFAFNSVYNISPSQIKRKIERPASPVLGRFGRGLLPTLREIIDKKADSEVDENQKAYPGLNYQDIYNKIICYFKQLSPEVKDLNVEYDDYRNIYEAEVLFENGDKIPLEQMSDGTMKWLYLITALLLSPGIFLLEEPENFLHPKMQQQFIDLARSVLEFKSGIAVFSTHSETILNALEAKEMLVSYFQTDRTYANKIKNLSKLEETLRETGFQLGQYYALGTLDYKSQE